MFKVALDPRVGERAAMARMQCSCASVPCSSTVRRGARLYTRHQQNAPVVLIHWPAGPRRISPSCICRPHI